MQPSRGQHEVRSAVANFASFQLRCAIGVLPRRFREGGSDAPENSGGRIAEGDSMADDDGRSNPVKGMVEGVKAVAKQAIGAVAGQDFLVREGKAQKAQASGYIPSAPAAEPVEFAEPTTP